MVTRLSLVAHRFLRLGAVLAGVLFAPTRALTSEHRPAQLSALHVNFGDFPPAAMPGLNGQRSNRINFPIKTKAQVEWQAHVVGGIRPGAAVSSDGRLVLATSSGSLVQLDPEGRQQWNRKLSASPKTPPVISTNGVRAVLLETHQLLGFDERGRLLFQTALTPPPGANTYSLTPLMDGGFLALLGSAAARVYPDGKLRAYTQFRQRLRQLYVTEDDRLLFMTDDGELFYWSEIAEVIPIGDSSFSSYPTPVLVGKQLIGLDSANRVVALSLEDGSLSTLGESRHLPSTALAANSTSVLLVHRAGATWFGRANSPVELKLWPALSIGQSAVAPLLGPDGSAALISPSGELTLVGNDQHFTTLSDVRCNQAAALVPGSAGPQHELVLACGSGTVWKFKLLAD